MYQQKGDSAKGGNKFWEGIPDVPFNPRSCFLPVGWGSRPWEMGFRPRTEITSLFASLMGRLTASLSGRLTAFLPHKAGGSRHCDGGAHGGEICWESRMLPLGRESLGTPQGVPLGTPHGVPPPRSQSRWVPSLRLGCSQWWDLLGKLDVTSWSPVSRDASGRPSWDASRRSTPFRSQSRRVPSLRRGCSRWRDLLGKSEVTSWSRVSRDASWRSTPQITKPVGPVIATGVLTVARFVPHGNWMTHLLANSPVGGCWARRPCHSLVGPKGATWVTPVRWILF